MFKYAHLSRDVQVLVTSFLCFKAVCDGAETLHQQRKGYGEPMSPASPTLLALQPMPSLEEGIKGESLAQFRADWPGRRSELCLKGALPAELQSYRSIT